MASAEISDLIERYRSQMPHWFMDSWIRLCHSQNPDKGAILRHCAGTLASVLKCFYFKLQDKVHPLDVNGRLGIYDDSGMTVAFFMAEDGTVGRVVERSVAPEQA